jgi:hypothetical protein
VRRNNTKKNERTGSYRLVGVELEAVGSISLLFDPSATLGRCSNAELPS